MITLSSPRRSWLLTARLAFTILGITLAASGCQKAAKNDPGSRPAPAPGEGAGAPETHGPRTSAAGSAPVAAPTAAEPAPVPETPKPVVVVDAGTTAAADIAVALDVAPPPTAVATARAALEGKNAKESVAAAAELRKYLDSAAQGAADVGDGAKLLLETTLPRAVEAALSGDFETAAALGKTLTSEGGALAASVASVAGDAAAGVGKLLAFVAKAPSVADAEALSELSAASGPEGALARRWLDALIAPSVAAFESADPAIRATAAAKVFEGDAWKCAGARVEGADPRTCGPAYFGLQNDDQVSAVAHALPVMRAAALAKLAGDKAPKGTIALTIPPESSTDTTSGSAERAAWLPLESLVITPEGARVAERAVYDFATGSLLSGTAWSGQPDQDAASLIAAKDVVGVERLSKAITAKRADKAREDAVSSAVEGAPDPRNGARERGGWSIGVAVTAGTPASVLFAALGGALDAGFADARFWQSSGDRFMAPLAVPLRPGFVPEARRGRDEEAVRVTITAEGFTIAAPKFKGAAVEPIGDAIPLPEAAKATLKGTKLVKVDVASVDPAVLVQALASVRRDTGAGTVVIVDASPDTPASQVLNTLAAIAKAPGEAQAKVSEVLPGIQCKDEQAAIEAPECRTLFPVLDVALPEPKKVVEKPVEKPIEEPKEQLGFCEQGDIQAVIKARTGAVRFCYERQLQLQQDLAGRLAVRLTIGTSGSVTQASASGTMKDKSVQECVLKAMRSLKFKPPAGGGACVVNYPFNFQP